MAHAATATYNDIWAGKVRVHLVPSRSTRGGKRVTIFQWKAETGFVNTGIIAKQNAAAMIASAARHAMFSDVVSA